MVFPLNLSCTPGFCFIFYFLCFPSYNLCILSGGEELKRENHRVKPTQGAVLHNYMLGQA